MDLQTLSDKELLHNIKNLVQREREIFTEIVRHLQEIQRRRLFSDLGYRSLWDYCVKGLSYSESQTQRTLDAMKLIQEIPEVEEIVERGELSLSNLVQAQVHFRAEKKSGAVLTSDDKLEVLDSLKNKSAREGEKNLLQISSAEPAPVKESIRQVTAHTSEIKFGADEAFLKKMEQVRGLLAHKHPSLSTKELMEVVFEMALSNLDPSRKTPHKRNLPEQNKIAQPPTSVVKKNRKKIYFDKNKKNRMG